MTDRTRDGNKRLAWRKWNTNEPDGCVTVTPLYTKLSASDTGPGNAGYQLIGTVSADERKNGDSSAINVIELSLCMSTIAGRITEGLTQGPDQTAATEDPARGTNRTNLPINGMPQTTGG